MTPPTVKLKPLQVQQLRFREKVLKAALQLVPTDEIQILETGTIRMRPGFSTLFFARIIKDVWKGRGKLVSIDINKAHINLSMEILRTAKLDQYVAWQTGDAAEWLVSRTKLIDFLYLDSAWDPNVILREFKAAERLLTNDAIVAIDDCEKEPKYGDRGKGTLTIPYAEKQGWKASLQHGPRKSMAVLRRKELC